MKRFQFTDQQIAFILRQTEEGTVVEEALVPGRTAVTMRAHDGFWFGFNLREDELGGLAVGTRVPVRLPDASTPVQATLSELRSWGEFAAWRAARAAGDHDLNTLFLRLDPVPPVPKAEPGQPILLDPRSRTP